MSAGRILRIIERRFQLYSTAKNSLCFYNLAIRKPSEFQKHAPGWIFQEFKVSHHMTPKGYSSSVVKEEVVELRIAAILSDLISKSGLTSELGDILENELATWEGNMENYQKSKTLKLLRDPSVAISLVQWGKKKSGFKVNVSVYNALLSVYGKAEDLKALESTFEAMREECQPDFSTYNTIISVYARAKMVAKAEEWLQRMKEDGVEPNVVTYNSLIDLYGKQRMVERAERVWADMESSGVQGDTNTYNILMNMYGKMKLWDKLESMWEEMEKKGVLPNVYTFTAPIDAFGKAQKVDMAEIWWERMKGAGVEADLTTFNSLLGGYQRSNLVERAETVWQEVEKTSFTLDAISYGIMMGLYSKSGRLEQVLNLYMEMERKGVRLNEVIVNILVKSFAAPGDLAQAENIFRGKFALDDEGNDVFTWNSMIALYNYLGRVEDALKVFQEMNRRFRLNQETYEIMVDVYGKLGRFEEAERLIGDLSEKRFQPNKILLITGVKNYGEYYQPKNAREWFQRLTDLGVVPDVPCFNALLSTLLKADIYSENLNALHVLGHMLWKGRQPDLTTFTLLFSFLNMNTDRRRRQIILGGMEDCGKETQEVYTLVEQVSEGKDLKGRVCEKFEIILEQMSGANLEDRKRLLNVLVGYLAENGLPGTTIKLWDMAQKYWETPALMEDSRTWAVDLGRMSGFCAKIVVCTELMRLRSFFQCHPSKEPLLEAEIIFDKGSIESGYFSLKDFVQEFLSFKGSPFKEHVAGGILECQGLELREWLLNDDVLTSLSIKDFSASS